MTYALPKTVAIIPAAGSGVRMGGPLAKQFLNVNGLPLLALTLIPFQKCSAIDAIILVVPATDTDFCRKEIVERYRLDKVKKLVIGGKRRQDSVRLGIEAAQMDIGRVLIHDGVRPVIHEGDIERIIEVAKIHQAVITGLPATETVKEVDDHHEVLRTYDRKRIWLIQTPQVFRYEDILAAHQKALQEGWEEATDDAALIEKMGIPVKVVKGSVNNIKVTTPGDLDWVRYLLENTRRIHRKVFPKRE